MIGGRRHRPTGDEVHTLIGPYVLDAVSAAERDAVEQHLTQCPTCAAEVAELRTTVTRLADQAASTPPAELRERVLTAAHRTRQEPPPTPEHEAAVRSPRIGWRGWGAVAAAVVLIALAVVVTYGVQQTRIDDARQRSAAAEHRQQQVAAVLAAPDARLVPTTLPDGARGRLVVSPAADRAVVTMSALPALPGRHTYQLWLVPPNGKPASAGVLPVGTHATTRLVSGISAARAFAISTEPAGGSASPTHIWATVPLPG